MGSSVEREKLYDAMIKYNIRGKQIVTALKIAGNKDEMISKIKSGDQIFLKCINKEMEEFANKSGRKQPRAIVDRKNKYWYKSATQKVSAF